MAVTMSLLKASPVITKSRMMQIQIQAARWGGHGRTLEIHPSTWSWDKFKDLFHFYTLVAWIPMGIFVTYHNLKYGKSELAETPENYEPEVHEYQRHPVTRFICKHLVQHPRQEYERKMHILNGVMEKQILRHIEMQVKNVMQARNDHRSWYFEHFDAKGLRVLRNRLEKYNEQEGYPDSFLYGEAGNFTRPLDPPSRIQHNRAGGPGFASDYESGSSE